MIEIARDPIHEHSAEKLRHLGIKAILFDLDDTLIYTGEIFTRCMEEFVDVVSESLHIDRPTLKNRLQQLDYEGYRKMGVSPHRWPVVLSTLSQELGDNGVVMDNLDIIMKIYNEEPRLRAGAKPLLNGLRDSGFKLGLVTHANTDWTERKLNQTGLLNSFDIVNIANENGPKSIEHWQRGIELLAVQNHQCLVVGDNLKGDIIPSVTLGTKALWMPSPWSVYREGEVPEGVIQMNELSDFWEAVGKLQ